MDGEKLHRIARAVAAELPGASLEYPFGPEPDVFMVWGKMFALVSTLRGVPIVTLKADPEDLKLLVQGYADIDPGYHMNKRHWVTLSPGPSLSRDLVGELVTESHAAVVATLPVRRRPPGVSLSALQQINNRI